MDSVLRDAVAVRRSRRLEGEPGRVVESERDAAGEAEESQAAVHGLLPHPRPAEVMRSRRRKRSRVEQQSAAAGSTWASTAGLGVGGSCFPSASFAPEPRLVGSDSTRCKLRAMLEERREEAPSWLALQGGFVRPTLEACPDGTAGAMVDVAAMECPQLDELLWEELEYESGEEEEEEEEEWMVPKETGEGPVEELDLFDESDDDLCRIVAM